MKPGEFIGVDGQTYRWSSKWRAGMYVLCIVDYKGETEWQNGFISKEDWPNARTALDALIEAEAEEWVEIRNLWRIKKDGTQPEYCQDNEWRPYVGIPDWADGYRKGREVALEQVQELVEQIENVEGVPPSWREWMTICETAEKVKL